MAELSPSQQTGALFSGVGIMLALASLVGFGLKRWLAHGQRHVVIDNLNTRIKSWWVLVLALGVAFVAGRAGVTLLFLFVSFAALREFMALASAHREDWSTRVVSFGLVLPTQYVLVYMGWYAVYTIFIPVYAIVVLPIVIAAVGDTRRLLERTAQMQWGLMICVFCISHVPALLTLDIPGYEGRNLLLVAFLVLVVQASDVLQYIWGKLVGKRPVAPSISPSKTWEGLVGGVASSTVLGAVLYWITPFSPWQAALMALAINTAGFFGGLVFSAIKRDRGVKDWGRMIEGHGGMLDRVDSVVFAAPVFFHLTRLWAS